MQLEANSGHKQHAKRIFGSELNLYLHFYPYHSFTIFITFTLAFTFPQHLPSFILPLSSHLPLHFIAGPQ